MTLSGSGARRKGFSYELEVAKDFDAAGIPGLRRTPNSGGLHIKGDLTGLEGWSIECKRTERIDIWRYLSQAASQAGPHETPLLIFRRSRDQSYACLPLRDFLGLMTELREATGRSTPTVPTERSFYRSGVERPKANVTRKKAA